MKMSRMALAVALCGVLFGSTAMADGLRQPKSVQRISYSDYYGDNVSQDVSPSDAPTVPADEGAPAAPYDCQCDACAADATEECDPLAQQYLFPEIHGWRFHGFINPSATANASTPATRYNGPVTFIDKDEFRLSQLYGILENPIDTGGCGWDFGGRVDLMYGTDYIFTQAAGLELHQNNTPHWNSNPNYGLAMPQAYGEIGVNNLSVKLGHFYAPVGYQVVNANGNFFISMPYTFQYGEPFTMTGGVASWKANDNWVLMGGLVNGWNNFDPQISRTTGLGGFTYTPDHGKYIINLSGTVGPQDAAVAPVNNGWLYSLVFTYNVTERWQYVFQHDNGWQENGVAPGVDAEWYGVNQYLYYKVNDCWKFGLRGEWFRDDDGVRLSQFPVREGGLANYAGSLGQAPALPGDAAGNYYEVAAGANWQPTNNLMLRSELRWDWSSGTAIAPFNDLTKDSQFIAGFDALIFF